MQTVTMATNADDAATLERFEQRAAELTGKLEALVRALLAGIGGSGGASVQSAREELVSWCRGELEVQLQAREDEVYPAARQVDRLELLIRSLSHEHGLISQLIVRVSREADPAVLAADAGSLRTLVTAHLAKERELVLPVLAADAQVSLTDLLARSEGRAADRRAHLATAGEPVGEPSAAHEAVGGHTCSCHDDEDGDHPELDARAVPHAIRHATIFGALDAVSPGAGLILVAPHDPLPLLAQIQQRWPDAFEVSYRERGPEAWRLLLLRKA